MRVEQQTDHLYWKDMREALRMGGDDRATFRTSEVSEKFFLFSFFLRFTDFGNMWVTTYEQSFSGGEEVQTGVITTTIQALLFFFFLVF